MNRWGKWVVNAMPCVCVVALTLVLQVANCQPNFSEIPLLPSQFLADLFDNVQPRLEEVLGDKLAFKPQFRSVSLGDILGKTDKDLEGFLRWHCPSLKGQTLIRTRPIVRQIVGKSIVAEYDEQEKVILVAIGNCGTISRWDELLAKIDSKECLQLALAHEVVRWHLDRRFHLDQLRVACRDAEEWDALQALFEGKAVAVTRDVAKKIGSESQWPLLATRYLHVPDDAPDAAIKTISQTALRSRYRACLQGMAFFDGLAALGVCDAEALVFSRPPRQLTVIAQPQRWVDVLNKKQPEIATVLGPLETALPAAQWQAQQQSWTPAMLVQVASLLGAPKNRAEKVVRHGTKGVR